jgi:hypothetical protein
LQMRRLNTPPSKQSRSVQHPIFNHRFSLLSPSQTRDNPPCASEDLASGTSPILQAT